MPHTDTHHDAEHAPELAELALEDKPDGPAAAAVLSAAIGFFVLGLMTLFNEMSEPFHDFLEKWDMGLGVGPLAGKTTIGALAWAISWIILGAALRKKDVNLKAWFMTALVLTIIGGLATFPPIFLAFAAE